MRCPLVLFGFALAACASPPPVAPSRPPPAVAAPAGERAVGVSAPTLGCRPTASTVYGTEPVTFTLESSSPLSVEVELVDQRGRSVRRERAAAPGDWHAPPLESGDFFLRIGPNRQECAVTVNRELARATSPAP